MRTLTQLAQTESARRGQDVVWILSVYWPDGVAQYAHRAAALADGAPGGALREGSGRLSADPRNGLDDNGGHVVSRLKIAAAFDDERLSQYDPEGLEVEWGVVFLDEANLAELGDRVVLFHGVVDSAVVTRQAVELECVDFLTARGRSMFGRELTPFELPETDSAMEGRMPPWIFGAVDRAAAVEWRAGMELTLAEEVGPDDVTVALESVVGLPKRGAIQIGDERLEYAVIDADANRLGRATAPLTRPEPARHPAGFPVRLIPPSGAFEWLAAGHACRAVEDARADGLAVAAGEWSTATELWGGETLQKIVMSKLPVEISHASGETEEIFNTENYAGAWSIESGSTATDGEKAIDAWPDTTAATLDSGAKLLKAQFDLASSDGERRYGEFSGLRLRATVSASGSWDEETDLELTCSKGAAQSSAFMGTAPESATPGETVGPFDLVLDLSDLALANGGWGFLDGSGGAGPLAELELLCQGDATQFQIWDLALEADYHARSSASFRTSVDARIEGVESGGQLLENPADIIQFLLCDAHGLGLDSSTLDLVAFAAASGRMATLGYVFSNRLAAPRSVGDILGDLLFESRCRLDDADGTIRLWFDPGEAAAPTVDLALDGDTILRDGPLRLEQSSETGLLREVRLRYSCDFSGDPLVSPPRDSFWSDAVSPSAAYLRSGVEREFNLDWHNHGEPAVAADLARALLSRHGFRAQSIEVATPLAVASLAPNDCVSVDDAWFPLALEAGRVECVEADQSHFLRARASFAVAGPVCWSHDSATFLRHRASGRLKEFWIEGALVATLEWNGRLRLRGELIEETALYGTLAAPVEYSPSLQRLFFGAGAGGAYTPAFALDADGNLYTTSSVGEEMVRPDIVLSDCLEATATYIAIGTGKSTPAMVHDVASATLQLRGTIAEEERF